MIPHFIRRLRPRGRFIVRRGILTVGLPLGLAVFIWSAFLSAPRSAPPIAHPVLSIVVIFVIAMLEWTVAAGWAIGALWWWLEHGGRREDTAPTGEPSREPTRDAARGQHDDE